MYLDIVHTVGLAKQVTASLRLGVVGRWIDIAAARTGIMYAVLLVRVSVVPGIGETDRASVKARFAQK